MATIDSGALRAYQEAGFPPDPTPWREAAFSVVDLEMTGLDPASDEIISYAAVTVSGGTVRFDDERYQLIRPRRMPDWDTIRIHGLREVDLEEAPPLDEIGDGLLKALTGRPIVAHVADVERNFLAAALSGFGTELRNPVIDTAAMDRRLRHLRNRPPARREPVGLSDMVRSLGLP
ncbi:MAG TPA: 3'-5' exonuclease, partial [Solirubrobacterales bacterium]|nr:3'-5' exonuclease [Solirubrobacterales bacterium]